MELSLVKLQANSDEMSLVKSSPQGFSDPPQVGLWKGAGDCEGAQFGAELFFEYEVRGWRHRGWPWMGFSNVSAHELFLYLKFLQTRELKK